MATVSKTLGELVDQTMFDLTQPGENGRIVVMGSTALTTTSATSMTLTDSTGVAITDVLEFGSELVLVTAKSADAVPVLTVSRGYFGTTPAVHADGDAGTVNPTFPRQKVAEAIKRSFARLEAFGIPLVKSGTYNRVAGLSYVSMPAETRDVYEVWYHGTDGRFYEVEGWRFVDNIPTGKVATGKALNVSRLIADTDDLEVTYRAPYRWSTHPSAPVEASTIDIPEGCEDLPSLYAAAWLASSREMSRAELDRAEEWNRTEQYERGSVGAMIRAKWQEFYRALDEARRLNPVPQPIIYKGTAGRIG